MIDAPSGDAASRHNAAGEPPAPSTSKRAPVDTSASAPDDALFTVIGLEYGYDDTVLDTETECLDARMATAAVHARRMRRVVLAWRRGRSCHVAVNARPWGHVSTDGISIYYGGVDCLLTRQPGLVAAPDRRPVLVTTRPDRRRHEDARRACAVIREMLASEGIPFVQVCPRMGSSAVDAEDLQRAYARQQRVARLIETGEIWSIVRLVADAWLAGWEEDGVSIATGNRSLLAGVECVLTRAESGAALLSGRRYAPGTLNRAVRDELRRYLFVRRALVHEVRRPTERSYTEPGDLLAAWARHRPVVL